MVNKVILIGNLGAEPEAHQLNSGVSVVSFNVATSERYKKDGEYVDKTEWHKCVAWGKLADICSEYLHKGSTVYIEGKLTTRKWEDKEGKERWTTEIVVREMKMLSGKRSEENPVGNGPERPLDNDVPF